VTAFPSKQAAWAQQLTNARAAKTFVDACETRSIRALPVKGIVSAVTLYDDPAERPLTDVDVRVVPADVARVADLCRERGWPIVQRMRSYVNLVTIVDRVYIDVEGCVGAPGMCGLHVSSMLDRASSSDALGFRARLPEYADHAVLLIVNAFKDKIVGAFEWAVRDLEQIPRRAAFDRAVLVERLREGRACTMGFVVAQWMVEQRQAMEWRAIEEALRPFARPLYARAVRAAWDRGAERLASRVLARGGADSRAMRVRALATMAVWQAEVALSWLGRSPYRRGYVGAEVRAAPRTD
jgi:hypothetical protein